MGPETSKGQVLPTVLVYTSPHGDYKAAQASRIFSNAHRPVRWTAMCSRFLKLENVDRQLCPRAHTMEAREPAAGAQPLHGCVLRLQELAAAQRAPSPR